MDIDRREHPRVVKRFEGGWRGASGRGLCTVTDLSLGGCFLETRAAPAKGEGTAVALQFGAHEISLQGDVVYVEPGMGFGVRFNGLTNAEQSRLREIVEAVLSTAATH